MHIPVFVWYHDSSWMLLVVHTVMALSPYLTTNSVQSTMRRSQVWACLVVPGFPEWWACIHDTHGFALFVGYVYPKNYSWLKKNDEQTWDFRVSGGHKRLCLKSCLKSCCASTALQCTYFHFGHCCGNRAKLDNSTLEWHFFSPYEWEEDSQVIDFFWCNL